MKAKTLEKGTIYLTISQVQSHKSDYQLQNTPFSQPISYFESKSFERKKKRNL